MDVGSAWANYVRRLVKLDSEATKKVGEYIGSIPGFSFTNPDDMNKLISYAYGISSKYGEGAAALACEMYDAIGVVSGQILPPAEPAELPKYDEVAKAVQGTAKTKNPKTVARSIGRLVKRSGADTTLKNAIRDGAEFAWIPSGDTCAFCIALASRGWQKASTKAIKSGHAEHIHANCNCTYGIRFNGKPAYKNYNPDEYLDQYEGAEGSSPKDRINAMRRANYAENKDKINDQKRIAYTERKQASFSNMGGSDIINSTKTTERDKLVRIPQIPASSIWEKVESGEYSLRLTQNSYDKHVEGTFDYERYKKSRAEKGLGPQSALTISKDEAQQIILDQSGTGIIKPRRDGTATNVEQITCNKIIGYYYDKGAKHETNKAAIHHGAKGSHLVPIKGNNYD